MGVVHQLDLLHSGYDTIRYDTNDCLQIPTSYMHQSIINHHSSWDICTTSYYPASVPIIAIPPCHPSERMPLANCVSSIPASLPLDPLMRMPALLTHISKVRTDVRNI